MTWPFRPAGVSAAHSVGTPASEALLASGAGSCAWHRGRQPVTTASRMRAGALAALLAAAGCGGSSPRPNILLLIIDSLRADHLGFAGYDRPTSPCLDSLASEGAAFTSCTAQAPTTQPSMVSLLTGRYPTCVVQRATNRRGRLGAQFQRIAMAQSVAALPEILRRSGYVSAAISANAMVNGGIRGLAHRFDHFDGSHTCAEGECAAQLNEALLRWLFAQQGARWFCYVHYMDTHHPYNAPPEYARRFSRKAGRWKAPDVLWMRSTWAKHSTVGSRQEVLNHIEGMYDAEIAYVDAQIRTLLGRLREAGLDRDLLLIIAADHGDELHEHGGFSHGQSLYEELTRCPLVFVWKGHIPRGLLVDGWVQNVDIVPTILDLLNLEPPQGPGGHSLVPCFRGERPSGPSFSESKGVAIRQGDWKLWENHWGGLELYDLASDPTEQRNLALAESDTLDRLAGALWAWRQTLSPPPPGGDSDGAAPLDSATLREMKALGYLE